MSPSSSFANVVGVFLFSQKVHGIWKEFAWLLDVKVPGLSSAVPQEAEGRSSFLPDCTISPAAPFLLSPHTCSSTQAVYPFLKLPEPPAPLHCHQQEQEAPSTTTWVTLDADNPQPFLVTSTTARFGFQRCSALATPRLCKSKDEFAKVTLKHPDVAFPLWQHHLSFSRALALRKSKREIPENKI